MAETRPFSELRESGLLWLINTSVLHPRGYALAIVLDDDGTAIGWQLLGDGTEPWVMPDKECDPQFHAVNALMPSRPAGADETESTADQH